MHADTTALITALCGRGWDDPVTQDLEEATALLAQQPELSSSDPWSAAAAGDRTALAALIEGDPEAATRSGGPRGWPPLLYAASSFAHQLAPGTHPSAGDPTGCLELLLLRGADPGTHYSAEGSDNGFSALYLSIAVTADRTRVDALLEAGASPSDGNSSYHAVETFDLDLLQALAAAGMVQDDLDYTVKHALDMQWSDAVKLLLDKGADPNAVHPGAQESSVHWAVKRGVSATVLTWLLEAGGDPNQRNAEGRAAMLGILGHTPLDYALRLGEAELAALLVSHGGVPTPPTLADRFVQAVARGDAPAARDCLEEQRGLMDSLPDEDRGLMAHWAQHGARSAVALGAALRFPLDSTAWMGMTAVHWAALRGDPVLLGTLLGAGAPIVDLGGYFGTPLHTAQTCQWYASGDYDAVISRLQEATAVSTPD